MCRSSLRSGLKICLTSLVFSVLVAGCGGGGAGSSPTLASPEASSTAAVPAYAYPAIPASDTDAIRFLNQATYGPTPTDIALVRRIGYAAWIDQQLSSPAGLSQLAITNAVNTASNGRSQFTYGFWKKAVKAPDQLRQRMAFALSQIFVVSFADACATSHEAGMASYYDVLANGSLGRYRDLLQNVTLHPIMGCYLSHLRNQREDVITGRVPDENFAREVLQLFSIGLTQLNADGTPRLNTQGQPIETYGPADITGLAKVFTGFSWDCPDYPSDACFKYWGGTKRTGMTDPWTVPMRGYPQFHSMSEKRFLGTVIPAQTQPDPMRSLNVALDTIAAHPNVAPFLGRQLIQRFVTSNPSPAYVARVAKAFRDSQGNLGNTIKAVLLDNEARMLPSGSAIQSYGKVREPVLRMSALLRAMDATSATGDYLIGFTNQAVKGLNQSPLFAPSVFNFYRPGYVPPGSNAAAMGLVAPELQITDETSMAGYASFVRDIIWAGIGSYGYMGDGTTSDVKLSYQLNDQDPLLLMTDRPSDLVADIDRRLTGGLMSSATKQKIITAISAIEYRAAVNPTLEQITYTRKFRLWSAILLTMVSNDFLIQK